MKIVRCLFLNLSLPLCSSKLNTSINFFTKDESFIFTNIGFSVSNISDSVLSNLGCSDCLAYIFISLKQKIHSTIYNLLYSDNSRVFLFINKDNTLSDTVIHNMILPFSQTSDFHYNFIRFTTVRKTIATFKIHKGCFSQI